MTSFVHSYGYLGLNAYPVEVEIDASNGLPMFEIVGLPDAAIKESKERVRAAMRNSGKQFILKRYVVNLSPADTQKTGSMYDLPILVGILAATDQIKWKEDAIVLGELSLSGEVLPIHGALSMVRHAAANGKKMIFLPYDNIKEVQYVTDIAIFPVRSVAQLIAHIEGRQRIRPLTPKEFHPDTAFTGADFDEVMGQSVARRALEIAAAGGHNILLIGPPGSGKSMLAKRFAGILPEMSYDEAVQTTEIYSVAHKLPDEALITARPFRSPHHTASEVSICGGGTKLMPGEISLAHNGVLFLDEFAEFPPKLLETLRQPLEDSQIVVSRAAGSVAYPADIILLAAMNPCPCGYLGHPTRPCRCTPAARKRYLRRISGPILDRIDLHVEVPSVAYEQIATRKKSECSADIRARVNAARAVQAKRYAGQPFSKNADLSTAGVKEFCAVGADAAALLKLRFEESDLSARGYTKVLKVARTIADLAGSADIRLEHIAEALQYRSFETTI